MSRHIPPSAVEATVRRTGQVEQLLGLDVTEGGGRVVRWLSLSARRGEFDLRLHEVEDVGSQDFLDVSSFPSVNPDDEYGEGVVLLSGLDDIAAVLAGAATAGAATERWVNQGLIDDEYFDARSQEGPW